MEDEQRPRCYATGVPKRQCGCGAVGCGPLPSVKSGYMVAYATESRVDPVRPMTATEVQERSAAGYARLAQACERFVSSPIQPMVDRTLARRTLS